MPLLQVAEKPPVIEAVPERVRPPAELVSVAEPPAVSGPPTVPNPDELRTKFRTTASVAVPVVTVDVVLVSSKSWLALITSVPEPSAVEDVILTLEPLTALVKVTAPLLEVITTSPDVEVIVALVALVKAPVPVSVISPVARRFPVWVIEVPWLTVRFPAEVIAPEPE